MAEEFRFAVVALYRRSLRYDAILQSILLDCTPWRFISPKTPKVAPPYGLRKRENHRSIVVSGVRSGYPKDPDKFDPLRGTVWRETVLPVW
jgi:hypothetical protein